MSEDQHDEPPQSSKTTQSLADSVSEQKPAVAAADDDDDDDDSDKPQWSGLDTAATTTATATAAATAAATTAAADDATTSIGTSTIDTADTTNTSTDVTETASHARESSPASASQESALLKRSTACSREANQVDAQPLQRQQQQQQQQQVRPFRMHLLKKTRKRPRSSLSSSSSSGSSSSGSEDEDDERIEPLKQKYDEHVAAPPVSQDAVAAEAEAVEITNAPASSETAATAVHIGNAAGDGATNGSTVPQPEGWRVKLYRLNADGSWDDCGTGRIVCLYRPPTTVTNKAVAVGTSNSTSTSTNNTIGGGGGGGGTGQGASNHVSNHSSDPSGVGQGTTNGGGSHDTWLYQETGEATLCVHAEVTKQQRQPRVLLRTRILLRDAYQRQGENIITWCEPYYGRGGGNGGHGLLSQQQQSTNQQQQQQQQGGVDLALSFQDNAGCLDIWRQITHVQGRAAELIRQVPSSRANTNGASSGGTSTSSSSSMNNTNDENAGGACGSGSSVQDMAAQVAAQHHADLQRQQQHEFWAHLTEDQQQQQDVENGMPFGPGSNSLLEAAQSLPNPPTLQNLEEIADTIAALQHIQQRESLAMWISQEDCSYLKALLALFPAAEARGDYGKLATLAACVKTILLLNEPSILELIVTMPSVFEQICSCLEYDPDLREKANHRWFLRDRAKFRTVVPMEDPELVNAIHRSFRVNYLRDTLLRPTMDESSLSTLSSLQTFTHADVVKGVTVSESSDVSLKDSYLVRVIRLLGIELHALSFLEWAEAVSQRVEAPAKTEPFLHEGLPTESIVVGKHSGGTSATWKQYLAPQDVSLSSRRLRRRGCLSFLRELFNMVRMSLQQSDKDDFFSVICTLAVDLNDDGEIADNVSQTSQTVEVGSYAGSVKSERLDEKPEAPLFMDLPPPPSPVNLLSLMGSVLSDPSTDVTEKGSVLEIIVGVAMHNPSLIRRNCLEYHDAWKQERHGTSGGSKEISGRPEPNEKKQVLFLCPRSDLLASLLFLLDVETDAGILLQVSEIMRIILDADMMGDHGPLNAGFADEAEPPGSVHSPPHDQHNQPSGAGATTTDQKQFLSMFYEHYVEWLVAPFQSTILHPVRRVPEHVLRNPNESPLMQRILSSFHKGVSKDDDLFRKVPGCAIRSSFAVELLSFCVRAHLYRMKFFLLKSRVLGNVLKLLRSHPNARAISGDRCLKLAALRFLRAILSVNDEFYHRHIIHHNLFDPVFEAFRSNPVGDNLVSSAIVEMCDFIHGENIKSLLEYIVTKHLSASNQATEVPSLEDVSSPYVNTLTVLRKAYEVNLNASKKAQESDGAGHSSPGGSRYFPGGSIHRVLHGKALEDQRKFHEVDQEESYFDSDDDDERGNVVPGAIDEVPPPPGERELHRTPRMFSLAQAPLLNNLDQPNLRHDQGIATMGAKESYLEKSAGLEETSEKK